MSDATRDEALAWLNSSPPRHFPPPEGWAWCEPIDESTHWHLFFISMSPETPADICETMRGQS